MLFRRLSQSLLAQNWMAISIEFVLLVAGVYLGIQAANWNETRHDRAIEREYLQRLYDDMTGSLADYDADSKEARWDAERLAEQALVLRALRTGVLADADRAAFDRGLVLFGYVGGPQVRWSTAEELQSTGSMNVIQDVALRGLIGRLNASVERKEGISSTMSSTINAFRLQVGSRFSIVELKGYESATLQYDFPALVADPEFVNVLSQIDALARLKLRSRLGLMDDERTLRDALAVRLGIRPGEPP
jgi:hypothetical protein